MDPSAIRFPAWLSQDQREAAQQRATDEALLQYRRHVEAPAEEALREFISC